MNWTDEEIVVEYYEKHTNSIRVNRKPINNIRYADDTVIFADSLEDLQRLMNKIVECGQEYKLTIKIKKTKFVKITNQNY